MKKGKKTTGRVKIFLETKDAAINIVIHSPANCGQFENNPFRKTFYTDRKLKRPTKKVRTFSQPGKIGSNLFPKEFYARL
jgi:hypothetical protein